MLQITNGDLQDDRSKVIEMHIHGRKHNAVPEYSDRARFKEVLEGISEKSRNLPNPPRVIGNTMALVVFHVLGLVALAAAVQFFSANRKHDTR